jgi:membrane protease YdiL (CAAX protease family)
MREQASYVHMVSNTRLLVPYAAPYFIYVAIGMILSNFTSPAGAYLARIVIIPVVLFLCKDYYFSPRGPYDTKVSILTGGLFGILGVFLWVILLKAFAAEDRSSVSTLLFFLKSISIVLLVPIFEEYFIRGYVLRLALQWEWARKRGEARPLERAMEDDSILRVENGAWSSLAILISSLCFMVGHNLEQWPAAFGYSLLISVLWVLRKDLASCVCAHAATNLGLALYVAASGHWEYW